MGRSWNTDTNYIGLADGSIAAARAMVRVPASQRWDAQKIEAVTMTPLNFKTVNFDRLEEATDPHRGGVQDTATTAQRTLPMFVVCP